MSNFFYGWRRKAALAGVVLVLLFMALWVRSQHTIDSLTLRTEAGQRYSVVSSAGQLEWSRSNGSGQYVHQPIFLNIGWETTQVDEQNLLDPTSYGWEIDSEWRWGEFRFGQYHIGGALVRASTADWSIPLWSIILLCTSISAWLLVGDRQALFKQS